MPITYETVQTVDLSRESLSSTGVATFLGSDGKHYMTQLPAIAQTETHTLSKQALKTFFRKV